MKNRNRMLVVIDTNILLVSISNRSKYHWLYKAIIDRKIDIAFTTSILNEYEELISSHWHKDVAANVVRHLVELSTAHLVVTYFNLRIITSDEDDNKFIDCAFAANADYIVTNDKDFDILKQVSFPTINVVDINSFKEILLSNRII